MRRLDCAGKCGGDLTFDVCEVCGGSGKPDGNCDCFGNVDDCAGVCGGKAKKDVCGKCNGKGIPEGDCDCFGNTLNC